MAPDLAFGARTWVMGVVNLTGDSFSGDGLVVGRRSVDEVVSAAVGQARSFAEAGAEIIDVGAESSRPRNAYGDHPPVTAEDEAALAVPAVRAIVGELGDRVVVSVDTSKGPVARAALDAGATIVNDVWAVRRDSGTAAAAAAAGAHLVVMHNQEGDAYPAGLFDTVIASLSAAIEAAEGAGVAPDRIVVDPGIGCRPLLVGPSRKRFLGELLGGAQPGERLEGTAATVALAIAAGADIVRVHDVTEMARVRTVADAIIRR
jgi:dihydropteroate synthase